MNSKGHDKAWELWIAIASAAIAIIAVGLSYLSWHQAVEAARATVWNDFLLRWDDDKMAEAKVTLKKYYEELRQSSGLRYDDTKLAAYVTARTEMYLGHYVYSADTADNLLANDIYPIVNDIHPTHDEEWKASYFRQVDQSRRRMKNFFENVMLFVEEHYADERYLRGRWDSGTARELKDQWLPIELGQNHAAHRGASKGEQEKRDKKARDMVAWYERKLRW